MKPLAGQVALVTGAGSGIGRALALALARLGASLVLVGRRAAPLEEVANLIASEAAARVLPADLSQPDTCRQIADSLADEPGALDILIHSAGVVRSDSAGTADATGLDEMYRTNVLAPLVLSRATLPMLRRRPGQVVFVNSSAGVTVPPGASQYAASKHALKAVADGLRAEVNAEGIRVLSIFPGRTATPTQQRLYSEQSRLYAPERLLQVDDIASLVTTSLLLPRTAEVTDLHVRPMIKPD